MPKISPLIVMHELVEVVRLSLGITVHFFKVNILHHVIGQVEHDQLLLLLGDAQLLEADLNTGLVELVVVMEQGGDK